MTALGSQQKGPQFLHQQYPNVGREREIQRENERQTARVHVDEEPIYTVRGMKIIQTHKLTRACTHTHTHTHTNTHMHARTHTHRVEKLHHFT